MPQYICRSAHELARLIRDGKATSMDIVKEHVDWGQGRNGALNTVVALFEAEALATSAERDWQARDGRFLGPLHAVPVTIKERFWFQGKKTRSTRRCTRTSSRPRTPSSWIASARAGRSSSGKPA
jgi:Asp-tRNA(Asn)/Glu-tRNA(Gln) amidotransferase A subunit family amidase